MTSFNRCSSIHTEPPTSSCFFWVQNPFFFLWYSADSWWDGTNPAILSPKKMHPSTQEQGKTWPKVDKEKWPKKKKTRRKNRSFLWQWHVKNKNPRWQIIWPLRSLTLPYPHDDYVRCRFCLHCDFILPCLVPVPRGSVVLSFPHSQNPPQRWKLSPQFNHPIISLAPDFSLPLPQGTHSFFYYAIAIGLQFFYISKNCGINTIDVPIITIMWNCHWQV